MRRAEILLQEALSLPDDERAENAGALLESLEPAPEADVETAWRQEVAARVAALEAGEVTTTPWEEIRDQVLARLTRRGKPVALLSPVPAKERTLSAAQKAALERLLSQSHDLGGQAPSRDELHER